MLIAPIPIPFSTHRHASQGFTPGDQIHSRRFCHWENYGDNTFSTHPTHICKASWKRVLESDTQTSNAIASFMEGDALSGFQACKPLSKRDLTHHVWCGPNRGHEHSQPLRPEINLHHCIHKIILQRSQVQDAEKRILVQRNC